MTINNAGGENFNFTGTGQGKNAHLTGEWSFLNVDSGKSKNLSEDGFFDLAVPKLASATSKGEAEKINNVAKILHCVTGAKGNYVETSLEKNSQKRYCNDVSGTWHFGVIWGPYYGVTFAVKPKAILNTGALGKTHTFENLRTNYSNKTGILHTQLVELLKATTGKGNDWIEQAKQMNSGGKNNCQTGFRLDGNIATGPCFLWGIKFSKNGENEEKENCKERDNYFAKCNIGIIDVSRCAGGGGDIKSH